MRGRGGGVKPWNEAREKGSAKGFSDNVTGEKQAKALRAAFPSSPYRRNATVYFL